jgi:uncharacterized iron-regulated membrane protein
VTGIEIGLTLVLTAVLVGLAVYFGRRQFQTLRRLSTPEAGGADERRYLRMQAYRRLFCSALMLLLAAFLLGWLFLDNQYNEIREQVALNNRNDPAQPRTPEQESFLRLFSTYWIVALLVLMVLVALAGLDFWATARFGLNQHRRLQADQRALLQQETAQRRRDRNGNQ